MNKNMKQNLIIIFIFSFLFPAFTIVAAIHESPLRESPLHEFPLRDSTKQHDPLSMDYNNFVRKIAIPKPTAEQVKEFNRNIKGEKKSVKKENGITISGYVTNNKRFLEKVITPILKPHLGELASMSKVEMINTLALFNHELFMTYFGKNFYRWGGDMRDLDDPQIEDTRFEYKYGLDCSGFSTSAYELAVYFGLLKPNEDAALFSSKGFELFCKRTNQKDKGGREGTSNNFRVDTRELAELGRTVFRLEKGGSPTQEQINMLQAGDLVGKNGHFGIIVFINNKPYYLESGGYVLPEKDGLPYPAAPSLTMFAAGGAISVRRALPDLKQNKETGAGISISLPDTVFAKEGLYSIPLRVSNFNNIGAITIKLQFDSTVVKYKGLSGGPSGMLAGARKGSELNIGWFDGTGSTPLKFGNGDLFYIQFYYSGAGETKISFNLNDCEIANIEAKPLQVKYFDGSIKIK
jgi:hypothetical protein